MRNNERAFAVQNVGRLLLTFARSSWILFVIAGILMLTVTALELLRPYLLKVAIDDMIAVGDTEGLYRIIVLYLVSLAASGAVIYAQTMILQHVGQKIIHQMRERVLSRIIHQSYDDLTKRSVGAMLTNVTNDTEAVKELYTGVLVSSFCDVLIVVGIGTVMFLLDWRLAVAVVVLLPILIGLMKWYKKLSRAVYRTIREKNARVNICLQESLNGIAVIKAFARLRKNEEEFRAISQEYLDAGIREVKVTVLFRPMVDLFAITAVIMVLGLSGTALIDTGIEIGVVVAFLRYTDKLFFPIKDLAEKYNLLQSSLAAAERIYHLLANDSREKLCSLAKLDKIRSIEFEHVWFAYEGEDWVLRDVSFRIEEGAFWGIVGKSGAGKTTLIHLLLGFYNPTRGRILLNGEPIEAYDIESVRHSIGLVFQDIHLFCGTVAENIALFEPMADEQVRYAARQAGVDEMIERLPKRYDTEIGYEGLSLSAGERQLLSLARVLATGANTLILDEATSHIDSLAEEQIQRAIDNASVGHTMLVIAHRLSTIRDADMILVMEDGRIRERGTHDALMMAKGVYYELCQLG